MERIQQTARQIALLDVMSSFALVALEQHYCKPVIHGGESQDIVIEAGRHPVVEKMSAAARFIPNSVNLAQQGERLHLITGPNMGGKSTFLRQVALMVLMAQIGSFVPASRADIGVSGSDFYARRCVRQFSARPKHLYGGDAGNRPHS